MNLLCYFIYGIFKINVLLMNVFLVILSMMIIYKKRDRLKNTTATSFKEMCFFFSFFIVLLIMQFFLYNQLNRIPIVGNGNEYYSDFLYWIGDANELKINFPPTHFREPGELYRYHYFSAAQLAYFSLSTGISTAKIAFSYIYILPLIMLISSSYFMFKRFINGNKLVWFGIIILLLTTGTEYKTSVNWISHLYKCPFGFDFSLAFLMFSIGLSKFYIEGNMSNTLYIFLQSLLLVVTLGLKSVTGIMLLLSLLFVCFYLISIKKKIYSFLLGSIFLIIFVLVYFNVLSAYGSNNLNSNSLSINWFDTSALKNSYPSNLFNNLLESGINIRIAQLIVIFCYSLWANFPIFVLYYLGIIICIYNIRKMQPIDLFLFLIPLFSLFLFFILDHRQFSQSYFLMAAYPIACLFGVKQLNNLSNSYFIKKHIVEYNIVLFLYILLGAYTFINQYYFKNFFPIGVKNFLEPQNMSINSQIENNMQQPLSKKEYQAYDWIRENTKQDSFILTNYGYSGFVRNYAMGAFSERHILLNQNLYDKITSSCTKDDALKNLKNNQIDYVVIVNWIGHSEIHYELLDLLYSNDEVSVYKVI